MTNTMRTWTRKGYTVEERDFDYDLHKLVVIVDGEEVTEIIPQDVEDFEEMAELLDDGDDVIGWANGQGGDVELPVYTVDTEDPDKVALGDYAITESFRSYSRKEAEKYYNGNYDKGLTVMLSKVGPGEEFAEIELIEERVEE